MNKTEAAKQTLRGITSDLLNIERTDYENKVLDALRTLVDGPELEKNGLMPCGCGGSASYYISYDDENWSTTVKIACNKCLINVAFSALYELRGEEALADDAKNAWNTAMGWRVEG